MDDRHDLGGARRRELLSVAQWIVDAGLDGARIAELFDGFCAQLVEVDVPLLRAFAGVQTLHPLYGGYGFVWRRGERTVSENTFSRGEEDNPDYLNSPFHYMMENEQRTLRVRLTEPGGLEFPIFKSFRADGATDYYASAHGFGRRDGRTSDDGVAYSFTTDRPGGFANAELSDLRRLLPVLSLAIRSAATYELADSVLATYIGQDAGRRVLDGDIQRGTLSQIRAVLFYADLRGFTRLADATPGEEMVTMLNDYLDRIAGPVQERGGEILKFMGDGLLAVFETADGQQAGEQALAAAIDAWGRVRAFNRERAETGRSVMELDIALHLGDVLYGNVGSEGRLDFTVIGPAVNEASRIEAKARDVAAHLLVSEAFWRSADGSRDKLVSLGRHRLRDLDGERELFTVRPELLAEAAQ